MSHCCSILESLYKARKSISYVALIAQIAHRRCGNNRFRERLPRLKTTFDEAQKVGKSAFLGFLKYALVREACRS